ncbi:MAG: hypothetical protein ACOC56_03610 [Atribacterota bacterium]
MSEKEVNEKLVELKDKVKKYNNYNNKKKGFDKKRKKIGKEIKAIMSDIDIDEYEDETFKCKVIESSSGKKVDEDKLLKVLKVNDIDAIKEVPDLDKLETKIENNEIIDQNLLQKISECITENTYTYIRSSKKKK